MTIFIFPQQKKSLTPWKNCKESQGGEEMKVKLKVKTNIGHENRKSISVKMIMIRHSGNK